MGYPRGIKLDIQEELNGISKKNLMGYPRGIKWDIQEELNGISKRN